MNKLLSKNKFVNCRKIIFKVIYTEWKINLAASDWFYNWDRKETKYFHSTLWVSYSTFLIFKKIFSFFMGGGGRYWTRNKCKMTTPTLLNLILRSHEDRGKWQKQNDWQPYAKWQWLINWYRITINLDVNYLAINLFHYEIGRSVIRSSNKNKVKLKSYLFSV